jgi:hypothetical protein
MRLPTLKSLTLIVVLVFASVAWTQDGSENGILSHETKNHIGEFAMVCGVVVAVRRERQPYSTAGGPGYPLNYSPIDEHTLLYFDRLPPDHEFVAIIEDVNRNAFPSEPASLVDQKACVYGKISTYKGKVAVALIRADQIAVTGKGKGSK